MAPGSGRQTEHNNRASPLLCPSVFLSSRSQLRCARHEAEEYKERQSRQRHLRRARSTRIAPAGVSIHQRSIEREHTSSMSFGDEQRMSSSCLGRAAVPVKRVWRGLSSRLGRRRRTTGKLSTYVPVDSRSDEDAEGLGGGVLAGLGRLRKEVRTCEYRDVHVMWEMLSSNGGMGGSRDLGAGGAAAKGKRAPTMRRARRRPGPWSRLVTYCCAF